MTQRTALACLAFAVALAAGFGSSALGQDKDASSEALARRLFNDGVKAYKKKDYTEARALFEKAHALVPDHALVLFNLASAQARVGALVEASRSFQRFIANASDDELGRYRARAKKWLDELSRRTPSVRVRVLGLAKGDAVKLNGRDFPRAALSEAVPSNPGPVLVEVLRDGATLASKTVDLEESSGTTELDLEVPVKAVARAQPELEEPALVAAPTPPAAEGSRSVLKSPWLWLAGVATLSAAGATGYYFIVYRPERVSSPTSGTLGGVEL